jgi:hypothetical protein
MGIEFTTYWGSITHGLFVTWTHDPSAAGDAILKIKMIANRYAIPVIADQETTTGVNYTLQ